MAIKNQALTVQYTAWDTTNNVGKTGDVANHTLKVITDGVAATPAASPAEVDATNCPGVYKIALSASEMNGNSISLAGKSSTANIIIIPIHITTERGLVDAAITSRSSHSAADVATLILVDPANDKIDGSKITGVSGTLASQAEVLAIQNNTRVRVIVPAVMERPDTGSTAFKLWLYLYDEIGNMEAPDELPIITAKNQAGVDRSGNLGVVTLEATGSYSVTYTLASDALIEQLLYEWSIVEGGNTRKHGAASQVVDTTAVDFTTDDRTKLLAIFEDTGITLPAAIGTPMQAGTKVTLSDATETQIDTIETEVNTHPTLAEIEATTVLAKQATLDNVTYGLSALKTLIDAIDTSTELQARFTEIKGAGWTTETLKAIKDYVDTLEASLSAILGAGDITVNHNTGGVDNLRYVTAGGIGIDNATILAYLKTDYDAGNKTAAYAKGRSITDVNGRWARDMHLDSGTYTIVFYKQGAYSVSTKEITI